MAVASKVAIAFLIIFNVIFVVAGALMLAFGVAAAVKPESVTTILTTVGASDITVLAGKSGFDVVGIIQNSSVFMIVMGGVVVIIGIFGCLGACCEIVWMLGVYITILTLIILGEVALIIFAIVYPEKFQSEVQPKMLQSLQKFDSDGTFNTTGSYTLPTSAVASTWVSMQFKLGCCGVYGFGDYANISFTRLTRYAQATVSISCCKTLNNMEIPTTKTDFMDLDNCLSANPDHKTINEPNCYSQLELLLKQYGRIAIGIAAGIIALEVILILLAICICRTKQKNLPKRI